jgi:hypothetical protein
MIGDLLTLPPSHRIGEAADKMNAHAARPTGSSRIAASGLLR